MKFTILSSLVLGASVIISSPVSLEKRRAGQQSPPLIQEIAKLDQQPGLASNLIGKFSTIAGNSISTLLIGSDPCQRYGFVDQVVALAKDSPDPAKVIAAAQKMAALEKNTAKFSNDGKPSFCTDATLPKSKEVRCIVPVIDPDFPGATDFNKKANQRLQDVMSGTVTAKECDGKSVAQQVVEFGLTDCLGCDVAIKGGAKAGTVTSSTGTGNKGGKDTTSSTGTGNNGGKDTTSSTGADGTKKNAAAPPVQAEADANNQDKCPSGTSTGDAKGSDAQGNNNNATAQPATAIPTLAADTSKQGDDKKSASGSGAANLNKFTGALMGAQPIKVVNVGGARPFQVLLADGSLNGDFLQVKAAIGRACDVQHNDCARLANSDKGRQQGVSVGDCDSQNNQCRAANNA